MPSSALQTLLTVRAVEIDTLIALRPSVVERLSSVRPGAIDARARASAVNRAAITLLSAHIEGFLEDIVVDVIDLMNTSDLPPRRVPLTLRAAHAYPEIVAIGEMTHPERRELRIGEFFERQRPMWFDDPIAGGLWNAEVLTGAMSNPGGREAIRLLARLGMPEAFDDMRLADTSPVHVRLNELVQARNAVAHGNPIDITDEQVDKGREVLDVLGRELDARAASFVQIILGSPVLPW